MKPFILIVRGPAQWLAYFDSYETGLNLSKSDQTKLFAEFEESLQRYNHWVKEQEVKGVIQISSRLTDEQRILSKETEIDFELLRVIEGAKVLQIIFVLAESWDYVVNLIKECPLPNSHYSIEIREVKPAKSSISL